MHDSIDRQAAIDFFLDKGMVTAAVYVERMPSAQPEITRCKDCKYYEIPQIKKDGTDDKRYKPSICVK